MSREQKLFAAASLFQNFIDLQDMIKRGKFLDADSAYLSALVEADIELRKARASYEGTAVPK